MTFASDHPGLKSSLWIHHTRIERNPHTGSLYRPCCRATHQPIEYKTVSSNSFDHSGSHSSQYNGHSFGRSLHRPWRPLLSDEANLSLSAIANTPRWPRPRPIPLPNITEERPRWRNVVPFASGGSTTEPAGSPYPWPDRLLWEGKATTWWTSFGSWPRSMATESLPFQIAGEHYCQASLTTSNWTNYGNCFQAMMENVPGLMPSIDNANQSCVKWQYDSQVKWETRMLRKSGTGAFRLWTTLLGNHTQEERWWSSANNEDLITIVKLMIICKCSRPLPNKCEWFRSLQS